MIFINDIMNLFLTLFETYIIYRYITIFFGKDYLDKRFITFIYLVKVMWSLITDYICVNPLINAFVSLISIMFVIIFYNGKLSKKIMVSLVIYICYFISEAVVAIIIGVNGFNPIGHTIEISIFFNIIIELIFWGITLVIRRFKNVNNDALVPKAFIICILTMFVALISLELMIFHQKDISDNILGLSLLCIMLLNFILVYLYDFLAKMFKQSMQSAISLRERDYYHRQSEILMKNHEELRSFRHDINNHMIVIREMLGKKEYSCTMKYLENISDELVSTYTYSDTGNIAVDSVINYKLSQAVDKKIEIMSNVVLPQNIYVEEQDMVVILGNILDNAIEAAEKLKSNRYIKLVIEYDKGAILIQIKNSYDSILKFSSGKMVTRKKEHTAHGIGLQNVEVIVNKYNGRVKITYSEDEFCVCILLFV